jgi:hypothetical protein
MVIDPDCETREDLETRAGNGCNGLRKWQLSTAT